MAVLNNAQRSILYMAVAWASGTDVCPDGVGCYNNDVKRVGECLLSPPTPHTTAVSPATAITSVRSTQKERFTLRQKDFPFIAVSQQQNMLQRNVLSCFRLLACRGPSPRQSNLSFNALMITLTCAPSDASASLSA